jgi:hypothetical protein
MSMMERGGSSDECNMANARCPHCGKHVRSAAMTEVQKLVRSLSGSSRESQATRNVTPLRFPPSIVSILLDACEERAAHAESSVVFPLPAEAETSVKG